MSFDVVIVQAISDDGFQAEGINNGTGPVEIFYGVENSILANLKLAQASASDGKVWLTESAFANVSDILDEVYKRCHGVVKDRGYDYCNKVRRHEYECYFNEDSIVKRFSGETPPTLSFTCTERCPKFDGTGCALLNHYDADNDGIISYEELLSARSDGLDGTITPEETEFVLAAYNAGSINALCPGCYTSSTTTPITPTPSEGNKNMTYIIIAIVIALLALLLRR